MCVSVCVLLWRQMDVSRALSQPNIVLGCVRDVSGTRVSALPEWRGACGLTTLCVPPLVYVGRLCVVRMRVRAKTDEVCLPPDLVCVRKCLRLCVRVRVSACVRVYVCVYVSACGCGCM